MGEQRRVSREALAGTTRVRVWLRLTAPAAQRQELYDTVELFCSSRTNARLVPAQGTLGGVAVIYVVVDAGDVAGAVAGDERALAALASVRAAVSRLYVFEPVVVPEPAGEQSA